MSIILQPCFESQFIETATVKLKFAPTKSAADAMEQHKEKCHQQQQLAMHVGGNSAAKTDDLCGLSFHQVLANYVCPSSTPKETVYVHPLSKRSSSSRLSEKSFEMCTENLGSETGTDDILDSSILSLSSSSSINYSPSEKSSSSSSPREYSKNKAINSRNFPPPLTTISGANSLQVRPHREGGRLVIKAIESPAKHTYLRAERSNGRLRLCLLKDHDSDFHSQEENIEIDSEKDEEEEAEEGENENESYINDEDLVEEENQELDQDQNHEDDEDDESDAKMILNKGIDANNFDNEVEMGVEKFQWLSRCNEGGHSNTVLYNKPLWVTS